MGKINLSNLLVSAVEPAVGIVVAGAYVLYVESENGGMQSLDWAVAVFLLLFTWGLIHLMVND